LRFSGIQKTSLVDFPDRIASVLFTPGCNLRCPFCHNWRIVIDHHPPYLSEDEALAILESRKRYIDSVVITGGEPTIQRGLPEFIGRLKASGFHVKLDSNGLRPEVIEQCLGKLDYIAIDVKTSMAGYSTLGSSNPEGLLKTISMLKENDVEYEFRCTVVPGFVDEDTVSEIGTLVRGAKRFAFQQFVPGDTLDPAMRKVEPYPRERIEEMAEIMRRYVAEVLIRA